MVHLLPPSNAMVPTHAYKAMNTALDDALVLGHLGFAVITGIPGIGKTATAAEWAEGRSNVRVATLSRLSCGAQTGLQRIIESFGEKGEGRAGYLEWRLRDKMHQLVMQSEERKALLIVDEAQNTTIDLLEELRYEQDMVRIGLALIGNHQLRETLKTLGKKEPQLASRIIVNVDLSVKPEDVVLFCKRWHVTGDAVERVRELRFAGGAFRSIRNLLELAAHISGEKGARIERAHVEAAAATMGLIG